MLHVSIFCLSKFVVKIFEMVLNHWIVFQRQLSIFLLPFWHLLNLLTILGCPFLPGMVEQVRFIFIFGLNYCPIPFLSVVSHWSGQGSIFLIEHYIKDLTIDIRRMSLDLFRFISAERSFFLLLLGLFLRNFFITFIFTPGIIPISNFFPRTSRYILLYSFARIRLDGLHPSWTIIFLFITISLMQFTELL